MKVSRFTVRTSTRRVFRRCLRKWGWQSSMRQNLQRKGAESNINFWFGSAIHFAMEDFFGYNKFGDPIRAFQAYYAAFKPEDRPDGADEHYYLGMGMLDYFMQWYPKHNEMMQFQTVWLNEQNQMVPPGTEGARPLIEESFLLELPKKVWVFKDTGTIVDTKKFPIQTVFADEVEGAEEDTYYVTYVKPKEGNVWDEPAGDFQLRDVEQVPVCYHGTLDRVVVDKKGRLWIMDWKTAKSADTNKLDTDDQISAYMWAAEQWFGLPIHGFVYVQLTKEVAKVPRRLGNGTLSVDKKQRTTAALLKQELIKDYGSVKQSPNKMIDFYNHLLSQEDPEGDRFIRWDLVTRSKEQKIATFHHILAEVDLMIQPSLHLFPNPTRDCIWDCPFREACIMMDDGRANEVAATLDLEFEERPHTQDGNIEPWRENVPWPEKYGEAVGTMINAGIPDPEVTLNLILPDEYKE